MVKLMTREQFNKLVLDATVKAREQYGFGQGSTWNNSSDAFKHAYLSWYLAFNNGQWLANCLGNMHENETPNAPSYERNMDLWNNEIGREIAYEMQQNLGKDIVDYMTDEWLSDYATKKIVEKMNAGEMIINPFEDKRKYENIELERLNESNHVYSNEEYASFDERKKEFVINSYLDYIMDNNWINPTEKYLNTEVSNGNMIYVNNYVRADGTRVHGYYRRNPYYIKFKNKK